MINLTMAAKEIEKQNSEFDYVASKLEVANEIWYGYLSPYDRLQIMNATNTHGLTELGRLRECVKTIASMF